MAQGIIKNSDIKTAAAIETSKLALSVVDDVVTGGSSDVLSANMGKQLEDGKVSVTEYQFHQMLLESYFLNISWDAFIDQTLVDGTNTTMTFDSANQQYDFTTGQILQKC